MHCFLQHFQWNNMMLICGWTTLTSQCPLENDHKRQQICQIRHEKCLVVLPVFVKFVYFTRHSRVTEAESQSNCFRNVWSSRFSFFVYFSANGAKKCDPPGFPLIQKTGWTTRFFHALFVRSAVFYGHFRADTVTSELSTGIPSSHCLYSWYNN